MVKLILPDHLISDIRPHLPDDIDVVEVDSEGNLDGDASDAEVYVNGFYLKTSTLDKVLTAAPVLRWQQSPSAGVNHILTPTFLQKDIILTNGAGVHAIPISEFVLAFMLYHAKNLRKLQTLQDEHTWVRGVFLEELTDATLLILGTGNIGQAIASHLALKPLELKFGVVAAIPNPYRILTKLWLLISGDRSSHLPTM
jgi:phosphoglycerate dehydrogenase-like enzyme